MFKFFLSWIHFLQALQYIYAILLFAWRVEQRVFAEGMKYFKHVLMFHEIFLNIFDESQNIFLCSFLILTFSKFIWKLKWVWAENVQTGHQEDLRKIRHVKQQIKSFELYIITNGSKNQKKKRKTNLIHFETVTIESLTFVMVYKIHFCDHFSWVGFLYLIPFFSRIVWIDKLYDLMKRFFPNKGCHGNRKNIFPVILAMIAKRKNFSSKTWIL